MIFIPGVPKNLNEMQTVLIEKLHSYIVHNNPDLLLTLQSETSLTDYLRAKVDGIQPMIDELMKSNTPGYIIEEQCMDTLTKDLRPSKYNYIKEIFEAEFESTYQKFRDSDVLTYEIVNMINACEPVFSELHFSEETVEDIRIRYAVIGTIKEYLEEA
jgi:hypothetical protein